MQPNNPHPLYKKFNIHGARSVLCLIKGGDHRICCFDGDFITPESPGKICSGNSGMDELAVVQMESIKKCWFLAIEE